VILGPVGVWWSGSWKVENRANVNVASELEAMGFGAIWSTGGFKAGLSSRFGRLLADTTRIVAASGVVNIWKGAVGEVAPAVSQLNSEHGGRFLLGVGVSHAAVVEEYALPYSHMVSYLDELDAASPTVPKQHRILAALGPKMLALAAERSAGAHPYFVPVEHTALARRVMGPGPLLAPELTVVLETDPRKAREVARRFTTGYLALPNYADNLRRLGYSDDDLAGGGKNKVVDAVVAWGDAEAVARRVREHHDAGADHVCIQVIGGREGFPLESYGELAALFRS
jgi:probable F420-dependent oxidoreductase